MCCSVVAVASHLKIAYRMPHTATRGNTLRDTATHCTMLQHTRKTSTTRIDTHTPSPCLSWVFAERCGVLQWVAMRWSVLRYVAVCCNVLQCAAVCCSVLQCAAVCCSVLQCAADCFWDIGHTWGILNPLTKSTNSSPKAMISA